MTRGFHKAFDVYDFLNGRRVGSEKFPTGTERWKLQKSKDIMKRRRRRMPLRRNKKHFCP